MSPLADLHVRPDHSAPPLVRGDERRRHWLIPTGVIAALAVILFLLTFELNPAIAVTGIGYNDPMTVHQSAGDTRGGLAQDCYSSLVYSFGIFL